MLLAANKTPLAHAMFPYTDHTSSNFVSVVIKGSFNILDNGQLELCDEQEPLLEADEYSGDPSDSCVLRESEYAPVKMATDFCVIGDIVSPNEQPCNYMDASITLGGEQRIVRVVGDRVWVKERGLVHMSGIEPFTHMPITFENAFGGRGQDKQEELPEYFEFNPVGKGFVSTSDDVDGVSLPNLENPRFLVTDPDDKPMPYCPGFINRNWQPRLKYAGSCDETWQKNRMPLLPQDFDNRYYNWAAPDFIFPMLQGGEPVSMQGFGFGGALSFLLPSWNLKIRYCLKNDEQTKLANLDTITVLCNQKKVFLNWRVSIPCGLDMLYLKWVEIKAVYK